MRTLRGDRNRVLLSCDAVAVSTPAAQKIRTLVNKAYKTICNYGTAVAKKFLEAVESGDLANANMLAKKLNQFTRRVTEYCIMLEEEIVPHEDFPNGYIPKEVDPTIQFDCKHFIDKLDPATQDILAYVKENKRS